MKNIAQQGVILAGFPFNTSCPIPKW